MTDQQKPARIAPTVGRIVHFHTGPNVSIDGFRETTADLYAAMIAFVGTDGWLNLTVSDAHGNAHAIQDVPLIQGDDVRPTMRVWCEWPQYRAAPG